MTAPPIVALLGSTGRLGPAVARALAGRSGVCLRGLSRRAPRDDERVEGVAYELGDRRALASVERALDGASVVVDLLGRDARDAEALLGAFARATRPPTSLLRIACAEDRGADDARAVHERIARATGAVVHTLVLPRLVAAIDPARREQPYLDDAASVGRALFVGSPEVAQSIVAAQDVAELVRRLSLDARALPPGVHRVAPPSPILVREAIEALLRGAGYAPEIANHPDRGYRAPHRAEPRILDGAPLRAALPDLRWTDPRTVYEALGGWLARTADPTARPRKILPIAQRRPEPRASVDVHGARADAVLVSPIPALAQVADWVSPGFYVDVGRPCNSACLYCAVPPHGDTHGSTPLEEVRAQARAGVEAGCDRAIFVGGEPTIYPHLEQALALLREQGLPPRHALMTNGLRLAEPALLERLRAAGVATIHLSIDTVDEATYDRLSRAPGTFSKQRAALDAVLRAPGLRRYVYAAVTRLNAGGLDALMRDVAARAADLGAPPPPLLLAFVKPVGDAARHAELLRLSPDERAALARRAVALGATLGLTVGLRNLQACLAPELVRHLVDYYVDDFSIEVATRKRLPYAHNAELVRHADGCAGCAHARLCPGIYRDELAALGGQLDAFRPIVDDAQLVRAS